MSRTATPLDVIEGRARWCVVEGDALQVLTTLPDGCVDAVVTDPPYGVQWRGVAWDTDIPSPQTVAELLRVAQGSVLLFGASRRMLDYARYTPQPDRVLAWAPPFTMSGARNHGLYFHWEPILGWRMQARPGGPVFADVVRHRRASPSEAWWTHGCTKPLPLMRDLISSFSTLAGVVLDCYAGSGTTGVAALYEGRRAILVELDAGHAEVARKRCEDACGISAIRQTLSVLDARYAPNSAPARAVALPRKPHP